MDDIYPDGYDDEELEVEYCEECGRRLSLCDCDDDFEDLDYDDVECCPVCGLDEFDCRCDHWSDFDDEEEEDY